MTKDEALKRALEALEDETDEKYCPAITAIKAALEAKDEPVCKDCHLKDTVYDLLDDLKVANLKLSVQSQRTWVGLTNEEIASVEYNNHPLDGIRSFARAIEAKLKEKNHA